MANAEIDVHALRAFGAGVRLVDVREQHEWDDGHVSFAVHVPLSTVPANLDLFDGSPTYVICRSGGRSGQACEFAAAQGYDVCNVTGGMLAWQRAEIDSVSGG